MITLLVKGNETQAYDAAEERGIWPAATLGGTRDGETLLTCTNSYGRAVVAWFCEPGEAPFPVGSLLWYRMDGGDE